MTAALLALGFSMASTPQARETTRHLCGESCIAMVLSEDATVVWFDSARPQHADETTHDGKYTRVFQYRVLDGGTSRIEAGAACRQVAVEARPWGSLVRTTHQRNAAGECIAVESSFLLPVQPAEEASVHNNLSAMASQAGLEFRATISLPWEVDFNGVTTLEDACRATMDRAVAEGVPLRFGIENGQLLAIHAPSVDLPARRVEEVLRENEEGIRAIEQAEADARSE